MEVTGSATLVPSKRKKKEIDGSINNQPTFDVKIDSRVFLTFFFIENIDRPQPVRHEAVVNKKKCLD